MIFCGYDIELPQPWHDIAYNELRVWEKYYLPVDVKGLTVLDVGAGAGETAAFYKYHGAKKVVSIQPDWDSDYKSPVPALRKNAGIIGDVEVIPEFFKLEHMKIPHDFAKFDCEGGETLLYDWSEPLKPCIIEAHSDEIAGELCRRFPLKRVYPLSQDRWMLWFLHPLSSPLPEFVKPPGAMIPERDCPEYLTQFRP